MRAVFAFAAVLMLAQATLQPEGADAAEIKVLSTGNMSSVLADVTGEFERTTGHKLVIEYGSTTRMKSRIEADEAADLTINEKYVLEDLLHQARISNGSMVNVARSPFAIAVRAGTPKPDVSTVEALKRALLAAESIAQPDSAGGAQDGTYFVNLLAHLGIAEQVKPKIKLTMGGDAAAQAVASGGAQMGVAQRRNFIALNSTQMLEPLPDLAGMQFLMVAGVVAKAREPAAAAAFAKFLSSAALAPVLRTRGMEPYPQTAR